MKEARRLKSSYCKYYTVCDKEYDCVNGHFCEVWEYNPIYSTLNEVPFEQFTEKEGQVKIHNYFNQEEGFNVADKEEKKMKQIHTDISMAKYKEFLNALPEARMVSMAVRCLILNYVEDVKKGENPWSFLIKAKKSASTEDIENGA